MTQPEIKAAAAGLLLKDAAGQYPRTFASEDLLQAYCLKWWNKHFRAISVLHSVPNGANVPALERNKLIGTGMMSGAADLELKMQGGRTVHIEMKNGERKLDPKQEVFRGRIEALGHEYFQANDFFQFAVVICHCFNVSPTAYL